MTEEFKLQLSLLNIKYSIDEIEFDKINWNQLLIESSNNRILYEVSKRILNSNFTNRIDENILVKIKDIYNLGNKHIEKTKNTILLIDKEIRKIGKEYLVCKTQKVFDFITYDVDCLFKEAEYDEIMDYLTNKHTKEDCLKKKQVDIFVPNMIRLDMHYGFFWAGEHYIDNDIIWESKRIRKVFDVDVYTPNDTIEFILTILNLTYERLHIPLIEYDYIRKIIKNVDMEKVRYVAQKNNWEFGLKLITTKLDQINMSLFGESLFGNQVKKIDNIELPMLFTWYEAFKLYKEFISKRKKVPFYDIAYFIFAKIRFHLYGRKRVPIYGHGYKKLYDNSGAKY